MRDVVDEHRAGAALGAIAAELRASQPQLVAEGRRQRLLLHHVDAARLAIHVEGDQPFDRSGERLAPEERTATSEQVARGRRDGTGGDDTFNKGSPGVGLARIDVAVRQRIGHGVRNTGFLGL